MRITTHKITETVQQASLSVDEHVAQKIIDDAVEKVLKLTTLDQAESMTLMNQQLINMMRHLNITPTPVSVNNTQADEILEQKEVRFISNLFH